MAALTGMGEETARARRVRQPFPGARPFRRADAPLFFGRDAQVREALEFWLAERVLVISGPRGVGKTSLLRAGLLPALGAGRGARLLEAGRLTIRSLRSALRGGQGGPALACVDQFEDACLPPWAPRAGAGLLDDVAAAVAEEPAGHLLLLVRQDALPALAGHPRLSGLGPRYLELRPLREDEARQAITGPAAVSGITFASGIADRLIADLATVRLPGRAGTVAAGYTEEIEPLHLQVACRSLWALLPPHTREITGEVLGAWGGVGRAMGDFYDSAVRAAAAGASASEDSVREWLRRSFVTADGARAVVPQGSIELAAVRPGVVTALTERAILTRRWRDGTEWYQLSHDQLLRAAAGAAGAAAAGATAPPGGGLPAAERDIAAAADELAAAGDWRRTASARTLQAEIARAAGDGVGAERHFREALSLYYTLQDNYAAARVLSAIAELHYDAGDYAQAVELSRQAVERMPGDVPALTGLGYAQWRAGSPADAEATFGLVLRWDGHTPLALAGRGQVRADLGRYADALGDLDRALRLPLTADAEADARSARALALAGLGRAAEAEAELATTFRLDPERPRSRLRAGRIAALLGRRDQVRAEVERALAGRPLLPTVEQEAARRLLDSLGDLREPALPAT